MSLTTFRKADVIVSLESDFLNYGPAALVYARQFSAKRAIDNGQTPVRLYAIESSPFGQRIACGSSLCSKEHRHPGYRLSAGESVRASRSGRRCCPPWVAAVADDLKKAKGRCVVIPGDFQPESVHLAAHAINCALGNVGSTVKLLPKLWNQITPTPSTNWRGSKQRPRRDTANTGANPVYSAPASLNFEAAIRKARLVVRLGQFFDETSRWSHWHIPEAHYLETWSDARAFDGTVTIMQPLIEPLYGGKSAHELLSILLGKPDQSSHDIVKAYWQDRPKATSTAAGRLRCTMGSFKARLIADQAAGRGCFTGFERLRSKFRDCLPA